MAWAAFHSIGHTHLQSQRWVTNTKGTIACSIFLNKHFQEEG